MGMNKVHFDSGTQVDGQVPQALFDNKNYHHTFNWEDVRPGDYLLVKMPIGVAIGILHAIVSHQVGSKCATLLLHISSIKRNDIDNHSIQWVILDNMNDRNCFFSVNIDNFISRLFTIEIPQVGVAVVTNMKGFMRGLQLGPPL